MKTLRNAGLALAAAGAAAVTPTMSTVCVPGICAGCADRKVEVLK